VQEVGVVTLPIWRRAEGLKALVRVMERVNAVAPAFVAERGIGDDIVEDLEGVAVHELGRGQGVALHNERGGVVVQDHVHPCEAAGGGVLFLPVEGDGGLGLIGHLQEQRARATGGVIDGGRGAGLCVTDTEDLRNDATDFGGGVELPFALATLRGEMPHEIFIGIAKNVIALGAVLGEIERLVLEDGDEVGEPVHHIPAAAQLGGVIEVRQVGQLVGLGQWGDDLFVDLVADVGLTLERNHVLEGCAFGYGDRSVGHTDVFVADVFDEEQKENVVLILAGVHTAAQFVATLPEGGVQFRFLNGHGCLLILCVYSRYSLCLRP